jgi:hypothetical protein
MTTITVKKKLDADLLIELCSEGFSGGDENGEYRITSIKGKELDEPIKVPHEAIHLVEVIWRSKSALDMVLKRTKSKKS